jgi:long-chain acyl-CoA synthetase
VERFEALTGGRLVEGYGLTETSPLTHGNPIHGERRGGSIGLPVPGTDARIVDLATGEPLPPGGDGELEVRGPQVMLGYWQRPEETALVLRAGWLRTGDICRVDEDGYFYLVDRRKDMIDASGFKVFPREVEEVLLMHPAVAEAVVAGVPDRYRGETVKAFVVLRPGQAATGDEIAAFSRLHLAPYKIPRLVEIRGELPKSLVGKYLRRVLVEEHRQAEPA